TLFVNFSSSQNTTVEKFKYPLERELEPNVQPYPGPIETNPSSPIFFNINISQNSAPQNEPSVGISRKNPNRVVAAWRDFRYGVDPNANRRVGYAYSTNSGLTWQTGLLDSTLLPGLTRNSDPVVTVDTAGNFYIAVISINPSGSNLTLALYKSTNGGMTFPNAYIASQSGTEDKEWITTDLSPISPFLNTLYISWTSFSLGGIRLTKSTNGGVNWSVPVAVSAGGGVQGSSICISRNGQINVVWVSGTATTTRINYDRSTNGGTSFGTDLIIAEGLDPVGLPNSVGTFPSIDVDNSTGIRSGWLYTVFADNRNGDCDVFLTKSTNAGVNWSTPVRVNNDGMANGKIQYWPTIAVDEQGNIAILFMDSRNTPNNTIIEAFIARSYDGGVTFTNELVSSEQSPTNTPGSNVRFGDYIDIDYLGENIVPVWTDERLGGFNMDIYSAEITEVLAVDPKNGTIPDNYSLHQNYPNPFNPTTSIWFSLPEESYITLSIYNSLGELLETPVKGTLRAGKFSVRWDADKYSSGVYFYKLISSSGFTDTKKMMLVK
ncbi:MAG TPA: T9SS type A sorting domain-containing protein, partial [Ignavibacteria bacterium]